MEYETKPGLGFWQSLGIILASQLAALPLVLPLMIAGDKYAGSASAQELIKGSVLAVGMVVTALAAWLVLRNWPQARRETFDGFRAAVVRTHWIALSVVGNLCVVMAAVLTVATYWPWFHQHLREMKPPLVGPPWMTVLVGVGLGPVVEELLFRGVILRGLWMRYSARTAILVSAALFGAMHGPVKMMWIFPIGILLGWLYTRSRSVWPSTIAHALNNSVMVLTLIAPLPKEPPPLHWPAGLAILAAGAACVWFAYWRLASSTAVPTQPTEIYGATGPLSWDAVS